MVEAILVIGSIGAIYFGVEIADAFNRDYGEIPYDPVLTGLTGLLLFFAVYAGLSDGARFWVFIWLALSIVSYYFAFLSTWKTIKRLGVDQKNAIYALIGQFILPLGTALLIILVLALFFGGGKGKKRDSI